MKLNLKKPLWSFCILFCFYKEVVIIFMVTTFLININTLLKLIKNFSI